jgi:hypothetical protein
MAIIPNLPKKLVFATKEKKSIMFLNYYVIVVHIVNFLKLILTHKKLHFC